MIERLVDKMYLAEISTIGHIGALIEYVGIWNRYLAASLPSDVVARLGHSEKVLYPLYDDVASHFATLQVEISERRRWWHWRRSVAAIRVVPS